MGSITIKLDHSFDHGEPLEITVNLPDSYLYGQIDTLLNQIKTMKIYPREEKDDLPF